MDSPNFSAQEILDLDFLAEGSVWILREPPHQPHPRPLFQKTKTYFSLRKFWICFDPTSPPPLFLYENKLKKLYLKKNIEKSSTPMLP